MTPAEASVVPLLTKFTVPVGVAPVTVASTVAVSVTLVPGATLPVAPLMLLVNVVVVGASVTTMVWIIPELAA